MNLIVNKEPDDLIWPEDFINKIICGNCLEVMKKIPNGAVGLTITSPPYNMRTRIRNGKYTTREKSEHFSKKYQHFGDDLSILDYYTFHKYCLLEMFRVGQVTFWNIAIVTGSKEAVFHIIGDFALYLKDIIIWDKGHGQPAMHNSVINRATELILAFESNPTAGRAFTKSQFARGTMKDIWRMSGGPSIKGHAACFPLSLPIRAIEGWSNKDDIILDPFLGTGTTAIAAMQMNRKFIGIETSMDYCKIAENRIKNDQ
jgi:site-specific DNA-methyltransferase (adenine-specific)/modification methylase